MSTQASSIAFKIWETKMGFSSAETVVSTTPEDAVSKWFNTSYIRNSTVSVSVLEDEEYETRYLCSKTKPAKLIGIHEFEEF